MFALMPQSAKVSEQEGRQLAYTDRPMRPTSFGAPDFRSMADDQLLVVLVTR